MNKCVYYSVVIFVFVLSHQTFTSQKSEWGCLEVFLWTFLFLSITKSLNKHSGKIKGSENVCWWSHTPGMDTKIKRHCQDKNGEYGPLPGALCKCTPFTIYYTDRFVCMCQSEPWRTFTQLCVFWHPARSVWWPCLPTSYTGETPSAPPLGEKGPFGITSIWWPYSFSQPHRSTCSWLQKPEEGVHTQDKPSGVFDQLHCLVMFFKAAMWSVYC